MRQERASGAVSCAHCRHPNAHLTCPCCQRMICRECDQVGRCPDEATRIIDVGPKGRVLEVDANLRFALIAKRLSLKVIDLRNAQTIGRSLPRYYDNQSSETGWLVLPGGVLVRGGFNKLRRVFGQSTYLQVSDHIERRETTLALDLEPPLQMRASESGTNVLVVGDGQRFHIADLTRYRVSEAISVEGDPVHVLSLSDSAQLVLLASGHRVLPFQLPTLEALPTIELAAPVRALAAGGSAVAITTADGDLLLASRCTDGWQHHKLPTGERLSRQSAAVCISGDGQLLALAEHNGLCTWQLPARQPARRISLEASLTLLRFSRDGRCLLGATDGTAWLWPRRYLLEVDEAR
jgi:hypothetical protein